MLSATTIRSIALLLPFTAVYLLWLWREPDQRTQIGIFVSSAWLTWSLTLLNLGANYFNWWSFQANGGLLWDIPIDILIGWILLWGAIPLLVAPRLPIWLMSGILLLFDLVFMPLMAPVLQLEPSWLIGETVAVLICFLPAFWFAQQTIDNKLLQWRIWLLIPTFGMLTFILLPAIILTLTQADPTLIWQRPTWQNQLLLQLVIIPMLWGISAVLEFANQGHGTPLPFDPPQKLVTTGLYAYLTNPMQTVTMLTFFTLGLLLNNIPIALGGVMTLIYGIGFAKWSEREDMADRFGDDWHTYRGQVRHWLPRWRPYYPPQKAPARLYVAETCVPCSQLGQWFLNRAPIGLRIIPAEAHPTRALTRLTYESADGTICEAGVAALARALEHLNFGLAIWAVIMRLPIIRPCLQLITDAAGGDERNLQSA